MQEKLARSMGFWSAIFIAVLGVAYLLLPIISVMTGGLAYPPSLPVQLVGGIVTFLTASALVVLFSAIRFASEKNNNVLGALGTSFITLFCAMVSINRFIQLTVIQHSLPDLPEDLGRFLPYDPDSVMFALEMLGWGFFSSLAALFVAPLFHSSRRNGAIRWLFIAYAVFSSMSVIGTATHTPVIAGGFVAWGPILLVLVVLLAGYFRDGRRIDGA